MASAGGSGDDSERTFCPSGAHGLPIVSSYGGYSNVTACRLLIQTKPNGPTGTADAWTIVGTTRTGPCGLLPI